MDYIVSGDKGSKKTITKHLQIVTIDLQMIIRQSFLHQTHDMRHGVCGHFRR